MGTLYVVATPIGNLNDITLRALEILKSVNLIVCEDTRNTSILLSHYNISKPLLSYFQHSKISKIEQIIDKIRDGENLALVTDAGTPGISDPGGKLIESIINALPDAKIIPIPGACALAAALSASGMPADKFVFLGFPPNKKGRKKFFENLLEEEKTVVFYESKYRILKSLEELDNLTKVNGSKRKVAVFRELTKKFETTYRGELGEIIKELKNDKNQIKGEFVIVLS